MESSCDKSANIDEHESPGTSEAEGAGSDDNSEDLDNSDSGDEFFTEFQPMHDYTSEITNILSQHDHVNNENLLALNQAMQVKLQTLQELLKGLIRKCETKYKRNWDMLQHLDLNKTKLRNFRDCGAPYFKDSDNFSAPVNDDYKYRKEVKGELFLLDLKLIPQRYWTVLDKCNLVNAIKSQVLDYLKIGDQQGKEFAQAKMTHTNMSTYSNRLAVLLERVGSNFKIDWDLVSKVLGRHSEKGCYAMWHGYMKPELNRCKWTEDENKLLMSVAEKNEFQNWALISKSVPGRSENQCFVQFQNTVTKNLASNRKFTPHEDEQLLKAVEAHTIGGVTNWKKVSGYFINRTKKTVYTRYRNVLNPNIKKGKFSREEDCVLLAAVEEYGENFALIPMSLFPNRSRQQIKSRYFNSVKLKTVQRGWTAEDDEKLIEYVKANGKGKWAEIANIMKVHNRASCRTRYTVIEKFLEKNPNATVKDIPRRNRGIQTDVSKDNWIDKIYELKTQGDVVAKELEVRQEKFKQMLMRRPDNYRDMLRPLNRQFYELFKFSFDFNFGQPTKLKEYTVSNLPFVCDALQFRLPLATIDKQRKKRTSEDVLLLKQLPFEKQGKRKASKTSMQPMPVNWCTLLGLRAVTIMQNSDSYKSLEEGKKLEPSKGTAAENLFKSRFFKIFFLTALMSKLPANFAKVDSQTKISEEIILSVTPNSCQTGGSSPLNTTGGSVKRRKMYTESE